MNQHVTLFTHRARCWEIIFLLIAFCSVGFIAEAASQTSEKENGDFFRFVDVANEVYRDIQTQYVDEVDSRKLLEGAIRGMFLVLDEHSQYLDADTLTQLQKDTEGEFSGIGIHITLRQGVLTVIAPIPGTPAARNGIQPWDRIIQIEDESTEGITLQEAVKKLTGPQGTQVSIEIYRKGEPETLKLTLTRQTIKIRSVHHRMFEEGIGYIRLAKFSEGVADEIRVHLSKFKEQGLNALILDLRFNTGGLLREAIEVSELFIPRGEMIVSTKGRLANQNREYVSKKQPVVDTPVFVLVNEGTASASEIVAGAIQDHHLGVVFGPEVDGKKKNTFGKGSVQTIGDLRYSIGVDDQGNPLPNALRLTTAKYYTPSGKSIHHVGIEPNLGIPVPKDYQAKLLTRGMIGDPTTVEPGAEKNDQRPSNADPEGRENGTQTQPETQSQDGDSPNAGEDGAETTPFYMKSQKKKDSVENAQKEPFDDIMLNYALNEMKVYLILQKAQNRLGKTSPATSHARADLKVKGALGKESD